MCVWPMDKTTKKIEMHRRLLSENKRAYRWRPDRCNVVCVRVSCPSSYLPIPPSLIPSLLLPLPLGADWQTPLHRKRIRPMRPAVNANLSPRAYGGHHQFHWNPPPICGESHFSKPLLPSPLPFPPYPPLPSPPLPSSVRVLWWRTLARIKELGGGLSVSRPLQQVRFLQSCWQPCQAQIVLFT